MKLKNVKNVLIILFALVTVYLSVMITVRYREMYYVSDQVVSDAVDLLSESGINVNKEVIPKKIIKYNVVEGAYTDDYFTENTGILSQNEKFTSYATPSGAIKYINNVNGSAYEYSSPFGIVYQKVSDNIAGVEYEYNITEADVLTENSRVEKKIINELISLFGSDAVSGDVEDGFSVKFNELYFDEIHEIYKALAVQTLNGCEIYGNDIYIELDSNGLTYLSGTLIMNKAYSSYTADLYDQVNILFIEKNHQLEISSDDGGNINKTVSGMESVYCVTWSYDRSKYYLIPAWKITYADGAESIINAINGMVYDG